MAHVPLNVTHPRADASHVKRVAVFMEGTLHEWISSEARKLGLSRSAFCRLVILAHKRDADGDG